MENPINQREFEKTFLTATHAAPLIKKTIAPTIQGNELPSGFSS